MNVSAASEGLLFFGVFCLQAEWVHSENVTSCLVALHHQLPFLSVFLFTQCLFVYCVKLCSFMLIALCCGVVHSSAGKHLRGYFFLAIGWSFFLLSSTQSFSNLQRCKCRCAWSKCPRLYINDPFTGICEASCICIEVWCWMCWCSKDVFTFALLELD